MRVPKIKVSPQSLAELMSDIERGHIRIRAFKGNSSGIEVES